MSRALSVLLFVILTLGGCSKDKAKLPVLRSGTPSKKNETNKSKDPPAKPTTPPKKSTETATSISCTAGAEKFSIDSKTKQGQTTTGTSTVRGELSDPLVTLSIQEGVSTASAVSDITSSTALSLDTSLSIQDNESTPGTIAACSLPPHEVSGATGFICDAVELTWNGKQVKNSPAVGSNLTFGSGRTFLVDGEERDKHYSVIAQVTDDSMTILLGQYTSKEKLFGSEKRQLGWVRIKRGTQSVSINHTISQTVGANTRQIVLNLSCHSSN